MSTFPGTLSGRLCDAWKSRTPREQRALLLAVIVIAVAAWAQLLWYAGEQRQEIRQQIERLEYRKALAKTLAAQMTGAEETGKTAAPDNAPLPALVGLSIQTTGSRFQISGTVAFDAWLAWVGEVQRDTHIVLTSARLRKAVAPGQVLVDVELERTP